MKGKKQPKDGIRIITKYPNRRLYDRTDSQYIPFDGIKELIHNGFVFNVIEDKTGEDVTRIVLTQVIAEESKKDDSFLSEELLRQIIQFYGQSMGGVMGNYLEQAMSNFIAIQTKVSQDADIAGLNVKLNSLLEDSIKKNQEYLMEMQKVFLNNFGVKSETKQ